MTAMTTCQAIALSDGQVSEFVAKCRSLFIKDTSYMLENTLWCDSVSQEPVLAYEAYEYA
jgi:hypothetical protein